MDNLANVADHSNLKRIIIRPGMSVDMIVPINWANSAALFTSNI